MAAAVPGPDQETHHVPVAAEPGAQGGAETREARPVPQQQVRRAVRPGGQHQPPARDRPGAPGGGIRRAGAVHRGVPDVIHVVAACRSRADGPDLMAGAQAGAMMPGGGQIGVVEAVLGPGVAADVAFAAQPAGGALAPVQVAVVRVHDRQPGPGHGTGRRREADRERRQLPGQAEFRRRVPHRARLGCRCVRVHVQRVGRGAEHPLDLVIVRVEVGPGDRPRFVPAPRQRLILDEPALVLAHQHVRVDQGAAAQPAGHHRIAVGEPPDVEHPVTTPGRIPERPAHLRGRAREAVRRVRCAALEQDHRQARLGQPVRGHRTAEPGPDHHRVGLLGRRGSRCAGHRRAAHRWAGHVRRPAASGTVLSAGTRRCGRASPRTGPHGRNQGGSQAQPGRVRCPRARGGRRCWSR